MLDLVAAQLRVLQIARLKKSCRRCEKMVQEPAPSRPIPGSMASAALLAYVLISKYDDHLPSIARPKSLPAWEPISRTARWSTGAGAR
nr:hypothetical protein [Roseicitreum antarcticum]